MGQIISKVHLTFFMHLKKTKQAHRYRMGMFLCGRLGGAKDPKRAMPADPTGFTLVGMWKRQTYDERTNERRELDTLL